MTGRIFRWLTNPPDGTAVDRWSIDQNGAGGLTADGSIPLVEVPLMGRILGPDAYAAHAAAWLDAGATVVGGCRGTRPAYIACLRNLLDARGNAREPVSPDPGPG